MNYIAPGLLVRVILTVIFISSKASAQDPGTRLDQLRQELFAMQNQYEELQLWEDMRDAGEWVEHQSRCWAYLEMAGEVRAELKALNAEYAGRADRGYQDKAESLVRRNQDLRDEYDSCFASEVGARYPRIYKAGVHQYDYFVGKYDELSPRYGNRDNSSLVERLEQSIAETERQIARLERGFDIAVAIVESTFRNVERVGKNGRQNLSRGDRLEWGDEVITGPSGRVRLRFSDPCQLDRGPNVVSVGPNSRVGISDYLERMGLTVAECDKQGELLSLIRGTMRTFIENWGPESAFKVRVGTSVAGSRGTEVAYQFDPDTGASSFWLHHGEAFLETPGETRTLVSSTVVTVRGDRIQGMRKFTPQEYADVILETTTDADMGSDTALALAQNGSGSFGVARASGSTTTKTKSKAPWISSQFPRPDIRLLHMGPEASAAHVAFERLQNFAARNDMQAVLDNTRGHFNSLLGNNIEKYGLEEISKLGWRPNAWIVDCVQCTSDSQCYVYTRVEGRLLADLSRTSYHRIFTVGKYSGAWYVSDDKDFGNQLDRYESDTMACSWK